ncbi:MAG TPA: helix-turn-helix domain-containing protein [Polyangiaceae bacterium]|nr:helix-turn-helix domain-containing protein [Polyangiaceae bacterium]
MSSPASIPPIAALHWVKPPRQVRSQKTLERVLDAAEELIGERGVTALTVSEVVRRAGSSVGAFYARFPDKDALLSTLHERSCDEALATAELALEPARWRNRDLGTAVSEIVRFTVALCQERRGVLLAFIALAASDAAYAERRARLETQIASLLHRFLEGRDGEFSHRDAKTASAVAIRMLLGAAEYGALIQRVPGKEMELSDERVSAELSRAVLAYLGAAVSEGRVTR